MFTPQRNRWPALSITPRNDAVSQQPRNELGTPNPSNVGKGKAVSFMESKKSPPLAPPVELLRENEEMGIVGDMENMKDWRRFKEIGLLDEASMERRDREALIEKTAKLERELFDYQYNMGLLLIENKECTTKYEELREALAEVQEALKREQSAHLIALADVENQVENLRHSLAFEKQCVVDLEKALRQTRAEHEQIKRASETKVVDASALVAGFHDKSLEVQEKLYSADAKLAEASRKNSELERKLHELEIRESALRRERTSLTAEQEAHEAIFSRHKEDLREWERKLQEKEERLCEERKDVHEREEKTNKLDMVHDQKEKILSEELQKIDLANIALKKRDDDVNAKVEDLIIKEQSLKSHRAELEMKEMELVALAAKLNTREREGMQKLLDDRRAALDAEQHEFELDLERRRNLLDEELRVKVDATEQREMELNHLEEKLRKGEKALEKKLERFKEREKETEEKSKALKEREKTVKAEEKRLELLNNEILSAKKSEQNLKDEIDKMKAEINQKELDIFEATEKLKVTEAERAEHLRLQRLLEYETERYKHEKGFLLKEGEDLKADRMKFEIQWEALDEERAAVSKELQQLQKEKKMLEDFQRTEDEELRKNKLATEDYVKRELEALRLEKEAFAATMKHEQLSLSQKAESDLNTLASDFEARRRDLETDLQIKEENMQKSFEVKEKLLQEEREKELGKINSLKEVVQKEMEEVRSERHNLEKIRQLVTMNKKQLEDHRSEMCKDIDTLGILSQKLKDQRQQFVKERRHFLAYVQKVKNCQKCGEIAREYAISDIQLGEIGGKEESPLSQQEDELLEKVCSYGANFKNSPTDIDRKGSGSESRVSWFRKSAMKIFSLSPHKKMPDMDSSLDACMISGTEIRVQDTDEGPTVQQLPTDSSIREVDFTSVNDHSDMDSQIQEVPEESQQSELRSAQRKPSKKSGNVIRRTRTVKAVVEEAAAFLGKNAELQSNDEHSNDISESRGDSTIVGKADATKPRKRVRAQTSQTTATELDGNDSEGHSESVTTGGRKRKKTTAAMQIPRERRYNLRRHKIEETKAVDQEAINSEKSKDVEVGGEEHPLQVAGKGEVASFQAEDIRNENGSRTPLVQVTSYRSIETKKVSLSRVGMMTTTVDGIDDGGDATKLDEKRDTSGDVNVAQRYSVEDEHTEQIIEDEQDDSDSDESDESEQPGEASVGRKVWKFFTS